MSYFLPRLESGWHVDQAILAEDSRVVIVRFGHDWVCLLFFVKDGKIDGLLCAFNGRKIAVAKQVTM